MAKELTRGLFIALEGPEGCGKSTISKRITDELAGSGYKALRTAEPGDTALGEKIRQILLEKTDIQAVPLAELFLFEADRAQHIAEVIRPALNRKTIVICDRFNAATFAYQGYGLGMDLDTLRMIDDVSVGKTRPDLTIILDVDVEKGLSRAGRGGQADKMEARSREYHERVRKGYIDMAREDPGKFCIVDSNGDIESAYSGVKEKIYGFIEKYIRTG